MSLPADPHELFRQLNALQVDASRVYSVHNVTLRRQGVDLTFFEGKLAFLLPLAGRESGAVFSGRGRVIAVPREAAEKRSLARFLSVPLLDQEISRAYLRFTDGTAAELAKDFQDSGISAVSDPDMAAVWNAALAELNPVQSLRVMDDWLSTAPRPYFYAGVVGNTSGPFDVLIDSRKDEPVMLGQPRAANGEGFFDVWASYPARGDSAGGGDPFAPLDISVDTTIGDDLTIDGKSVLHFRAVRGGDRLLALELSRFVRVQSVTGADAQPLAFFQNEDVREQEIARLGNDALIVVLPHAAAAGEEFRLSIAYRGNVIGDAGNGVYFVGARGSWYPHLLGEGRFVPFDLTFRWPKRLKLVATGTKLEEKEAGNMRVGHWRSSVPQEVAGFNLGEYAARLANAQDPRIEVFANQQLENAILARLRSLPLSNAGPPDLYTTPDGLPPPLVPFLLPPNPAAVLSQLGQRILDSVHFFEKLNGPFPFGQLEVSPIPGSFGQGWPGLLYLSTLVFLPPEAQTRAGIKPEAQKEMEDIVPFHEVAHQWWGNVVSAASYRDAWLEEAMANYLALLYADQKKPGKHILANYLSRFRADLAAKEPGSSETIEQAGPLCLGFRLTSSKSPQAYETIVYGKGAWIIHMLRMMLREQDSHQPDARFAELLRHTLADHRFQAISTKDFEKQAEKVMTPSMDLDGSHTLDWFFDEWVNDVGIPRYSAQFKVHPRGQEFIVRGALLQDDVPEDFTARVPLYAQRPGSAPVLLGTVVTNSAETSFQFKTRFAPARILIDPNATLLCRTD
ncbi:MAG: M1 family aminopeptidase [Candidatus Acidiferrales bacterium]